jgi:type I restriction enzyme S subunit
LVDVNPESLGANTPAAFEFRYLDLSSVSKGKISWEAVPLVRFGAAPSRARRVVRAGDVLFGTVRPALQSHGSIPQGISEDLIASTGFAVLRAREQVADPRFVHHYCLSALATAEARRLEVGSNYPAVTERDVRGFSISCPPLSEQHRIGEILDTLDASIRSTEKIIVKLRQLKRGLLHDLLTRGIDRNGEIRDPAKRPRDFKETPLGRFPAAWNIQPLSQLCHLLNGLAFRPEDWSETGTPIIRIQNLNGSQEFNYCNRSVPSAYYVERGELLFSWSGNRGTSFGPFIWAGPRGLLNQHIFKVTPTAGQNAKWFYHALDEVRLRVEREAHGGSGLVHVRRGDLLAYRIAVPEREEQEKICEALEMVEDTVRSEEQQLEKLNALRHGVASDLLTGSVDVRPLLQPAST